MHKQGKVGGGGLGNRERKGVCTSFAYDQLACPTYMATERVVHLTLPNG